MSPVLGVGEAGHCVCLLLIWYVFYKAVTFFITNEERLCSSQFIRNLLKEDPTESCSPRCFALGGGVLRSLDAEVR